jgi:hypothetical protein
MDICSRWRWRWSGSTSHSDGELTVQRTGASRFTQRPLERHPPLPLWGFGRTGRRLVPVANLYQPFGDTSRAMGLFEFPLLIAGFLWIAWD